MDVFAGVSVTDRAASVAWYDQLLGAVETFEPNPDEWVWTLADHGYLYVVVDPDCAGRSRVTLFVGDYEAYLSRGLEPESTETYENGVRKAIFRDPDGNEVGIGGAPVGDD